MSSLPTRSVPQPQPKILPGGDCGYCCLAGIMGVTVPEAYDYVDDIRPHRTDLAKERSSMYSTAMSAISEVWNRKNAGDDWDHNIPTFSTTGLARWKGESGDEDNAWWPPPDKQPWGTPSWEQSEVWHAAVDHCLNNGYVLMTSIIFDGSGPSQSGDTNHAVLIVGASTENVPHPTIPNVGRILKSIQVSCSVRGLWTTTASDFLFRYGGFRCHPFKTIHRPE